jgi:adenylosuccinate synthase
VIGSGVVVNPATLIGEIDMLNERGIDTSRVRVSSAAHVIMPYHVALDRAQEARLGDGKVGTTGRGIGPGLRRPGVAGRAADGGPARRGLVREKLAKILPDKNLLLASSNGASGFTIDELVDQAAAWGERLRPHIADATWLVQDALRRRDHVLLEGAQGTLLDLDHGSYPFVTSSNPVAGGRAPAAGSGRSRSTR